MRTCFIGNVPLEMNSKQLKKLFSEYGKIEKIQRSRRRCIVFDSLVYSWYTVANRLVPEVQNNTAKTVDSIDTINYHDILLRVCLE